MPTQILLDSLRKNGLKLTPQRRLICQLVTTNVTHPTAEELHDKATEAMPGMSLKTVYTTLYELAELEAIRLVNVGSGGFRVESNMDPHSHLVCRRCGLVTDVPVDPETAAGGAVSERSVLEQYDFEIEHKEIIFRGVCGTCSEKPTSENEVDGDDRPADATGKAVSETAENAGEVVVR